MHEHVWCVVDWCTRNILAAFTNEEILKYWLSLRNQDSLRDLIVCRFLADVPEVEPTMFDPDEILYKED